MTFRLTGVGGTENLLSKYTWITASIGSDHLKRSGVCWPPTLTSAQSAVGDNEGATTRQPAALHSVWCCCAAFCPRCVSPNLPLNGARLKSWVATFPLHGFAAVKATDNNKHFTRSGNWKKSREGGGAFERAGGGETILPGCERVTMTPTSQISTFVPPRLWSTTCS